MFSASKFHLGVSAEQNNTLNPPTAILIILGVEAAYFLFVGLMTTVYCVIDHFPEFVSHTKFVIPENCFVAMSIQEVNLAHRHLHPCKWCWIWITIFSITTISYFYFISPIFIATCFSNCTYPIKRANCMEAVEEGFIKGSKVSINHSQTECDAWETLFPDSAKMQNDRNIYEF